jgi:hypothetical protein
VPERQCIEDEPKGVQVWMKGHTRSIIACRLAAKPALPPLFVALPLSSPCPSAFIGVLKAELFESFSIKGSDGPEAGLGVFTGVTFRLDRPVRPGPSRAGEGEPPKRFADGKRVDDGRCGRGRRGIGGMAERGVSRVLVDGGVGRPFSIRTVSSS